MSLKIASVFDVTLNYLIGEGKHAAYDKATPKQLEGIQTLKQNTRSLLFNIIDTFQRDAKA